MRKIIKNLCLLLIVSIILSTVAFASDEIKVAIDDEYVKFDVPPQSINNRTMVPLRAIFEALGADVEWNNSTRTVTATRDDVVVKATIGKNVIYVDGKEKTMDVAPIAISGRTLVPARFVAEAFGCAVDWDGEEKVVYIYSNSEYEDILDIQE